MVISLSMCTADESDDPENSCDYTDLAVGIELIDGKAVATATGGEPPYQYVWEGDTEGSELTLTEEGDYEVVVTDARGCTVSGSFLMQGIPNLLGNWEMVVFNHSYPVGVYQNTYDGNCPNIIEYKQTMKGWFTFSEGNTFSYVWTDHLVMLNIFVDDNCEVIEDKPDTISYTTEEGQGTYFYNGIDYTLEYENGNREIVQTIESDRIKIYAEEYVRR